jgi:hypothetical protein
MEANVTRDRKLLVAMKRHETDDTFFDRDEDYRRETEEALREMGHDAMPSEEEYENER